MYEDEDEKGVVIPLSGNAIEGESTLRLNKALTNLTMVMVHLYKYNAATKSYEKYDTYNRYIAFTGKARKQILQIPFAQAVPEQYQSCHNNVLFIELTPA